VLQKCFQLEYLKKKKPGHRSLDSLRCYERSTLAQHQTVSNIVSSSSAGLSYPEELQKIVEKDDIHDQNKTLSMCPTDIQNQDQPTSSGIQDQPTSSKLSQKSIKGELNTLSTLFSCSNGGTFNFCPSGNVVININPALNFD
jgi:hypothetical protein